jgi:hypothetical protein
MLVAGFPEGLLKLPCVTPDELQKATPVNFQINIVTNMRRNPPLASLLN